ncbi:DUF721 domain-containing protein [Roseovarius sp. EL26]|uniref:DUF721 domain-containing protein n=1 Tax=Roseovarius sp. EL26 TaxID=2126672 RepID=UPI000EA3F7B9|nr:DUF721 domain-containing protein [Roseovarius sp. EL26]
MPSKRPGFTGFKRTSQLLQRPIRQASESRGFAVSRVLTHWAEIVGSEIATMGRPVEVSYGRQGMGATLSVLTNGALAPLLEMQKEIIRERVNAVYGYNAIARVRVTQTAASGFSDGKVEFLHQAPAKKPPSEQAVKVARDKASELTLPVGDSTLREALEILGQNVLSKNK